MVEEKEDDSDDFHKKWRLNKYVIVLASREHSINPAMKYYDSRGQPHC